jgi:hypothetical protein
MRFRLGPPPKDILVAEDDACWHLVREPSQSFQLAAAVCLTLLILFCIALVVTFSVGLRRFFDLSMYVGILSCIVVIPTHELIHAVGFKGGITSDRTVFGFYPKSLSFYAHYCGEISRKRFVLVAALPLLILTAVPLAIVALFTPEGNWLIYLAFANGFASGMDVLTIIILLRQVPRQAVLVNSGAKSYWASTQVSEIAFRA